MLKATVRRRTVVVAAVGILGAVPNTVVAEAAQAQAAPTAAYACRNGAVSASDAAGSAVPTARRPNVPLHAGIRVHNTEAVSLPRATYVFALGNLTKNRGRPPSCSGASARGTGRR